jgi:hypothetical protein
VLLEPQPLPEHFLQGVAHRIFVAADDGLDLAAGRAQARFERIGSVQDLGHRLLPASAAVSAHKDRDQGDAEGRQQ